MAAHMLHRLRVVFLEFEQRLFGFIRGYPPHGIGGVFPIADTQPNTFPTDQQCIRDGSIDKQTSLLERLVGDGFFWAVPKNRRTVERRMTRRMGYQKLINSRHDLVTCLHCGHYHQAKTICGNCYAKVQAETKVIMDAMQIEKWEDRVKHSDKDVTVLYER
ncbi:PREDICTED: 39S ribosomal protein L32, mitochondrial-like [Priapulus caudatus]|uniref:Large ribosomal subunit protein bL32m n=1 Tax=Priapulus caudatus TaxID=37621 RepID=A0ABM1DUG5_PRICU|nr:PREDICTED: 39S ribosomal protein L32, mitochondrial-like [Priapulus caudatus]